MAATIGWYGPLIDLCKTSSYIGDYVQLLVFVHRSTPVQYKISRNGGEVVRMDILVGDETRSYFPVTIWQKQMGSQILAGHVFLLQNLKITRFGDNIEARAIHCSSMQRLLQPNDFVAPNGLDEVIRGCRVGITAKDKLQRVVGWLQRARLAHCGSVLNCDEHRSQLKINWKVHEEMHTQDCSSLSELYKCDNNRKAAFHASVGEIFLPITWVDLEENEAERMFISRRLHNHRDKSLVDDLITTGCELCGNPMNVGPGSSVEQNTNPLYCEKSNNRLHVAGNIYRPFLLYVWDDVKYLPILVYNKAAEVLFGNISAEKVYSSYKHNNKPGDQKPNFYKIWLILMKMLFQHEKNSPLRFKVTVDTNRDWESGRLEMLSISIPAFRTNSSN
ncbi:hypothetical protein CASFOL_016713 [Castilleja foliolosa]|uniref:Uncharacterized protein n=1 Tax=Castilleja foliolosa TaxID=1961234 RepID=A0ABD3DB29_9LAMI